MSDSHDDGSLPPSRPGAVVRMSEGESTLVGVETAAELEQRAAIAVVVHRIWVRRMAVRALLILVGEVALLATLAMAGVAAGRFSDAFALQLLGITLGPSFAAWIVIVKWAFWKGGGEDA
jgi:hypothetical protein